jgi:hypothetical protein
MVKHGTPMVATSGYVAQEDKTLCTDSTNCKFACLRGNQGGQVGVREPGNMHEVRLPGPDSLAPWAGLGYYGRNVLFLPA